MNEELKIEIKKSLEVLKSGGLILYPTDTIWGIGCDATNAAAINKVYELKKRSDSKSLILLVENESRILSYVREVPEQAWTLIEFAEKPLTIIYEEAKNLPQEIIAADGSIAIRVTKDEYCKNLLGLFRKPLVSTSANISGDSAPSSFKDISDEIKNGVDYIVNWRQNDNRPQTPSTILRLRKGGLFEFIRK